MSLSRLSKGALDQLAYGLSSGQIAFTSPGTLNGWTHLPEAPLASAALRQLAALGLTGDQAAAVVRLVLDERTSADSQRIDTVWSGPEGATAQTRDTAVVVRELFEAAKDRVLISSYVLYQTEQLFEPLARAMDRNPSLRAKLFVTILREPGDCRVAQEVALAFRERFKNAWPGTRLPDVFYDPRSLIATSGRKAVLHAKCIVIDGRRSLVTSANFTEAAQERNFELGLLVDDESLACSIEGQFETLIGRNLVTALAAE